MESTEIICCARCCTLRIGWPPATLSATEHLQPMAHSTEWAGGEPRVTTVHERAADGGGSSTMQMRVSLGEERPGTVVEKHMGPGHPNVHLRETPPQIFFDPSDFLVYTDCLFQSKFKTADRQAEGGSQVWAFQITAWQQQVSRVGQSWFRHIFCRVRTTTSTHPAVVSPARQHDDMWHCRDISHGILSCTSLTRWESL